VAAPRGRQAAGYWVAAPRGRQAAGYWVARREVDRRRLLGGRAARSTGGGLGKQTRAQDARTTRPESVKPLIPKPSTRQNKPETKQGDRTMGW